MPCEQSAKTFPQKHPFANLSRTSNNDKRCRALPGGLLRGGLVDCYTFATKKRLCYRLLQGRNRFNINEYVVFRDLSDSTKGLIIPWSQVRVLLGPPTQTVVKKGFGSCKSRMLLTPSGVLGVSWISQRPYQHHNTVGS